jgi:hypothetical protein
MATRSSDVTRAFLLDGGEIYSDVDVIASDIVYEGSTVGELSTSGTYRPLAGGDTFKGFCLRRCDNASGAASAKKIRVRQLIVTGVDNLNDADAAVYCVDDDTFTLTSSTAHTQIGKVVSVDNATTGLCTVYFESVALRSI